MFLTQFLNTKVEQALWCKLRFELFLFVFVHYFLMPFNMKDLEVGRNRLKIEVFLNCKTYHDFLLMQLEKYSSL